MKWNILYITRVSHNLFAIIAEIKSFGIIIKVRYNMQMLPDEKIKFVSIEGMGEQAFIPKQTKNIIVSAETSNEIKAEYKHEHTEELKYDANQ